MTVPLWLLRQRRVHVCTRVHTHVCVCVQGCALVSALCTSVGQRPCRGHPRLHSPWSAPSSGKLGSFFLEPMPCGSNLCFSAHSWG